MEPSARGPDPVAAGAPALRVLEERGNVPSSMKGSGDLDAFVGFAIEHDVRFGREAPDTAKLGTVPSHFRRIRKQVEGTEESLDEAQRGVIVVHRDVEPDLLQIAPREWGEAAVRHYRSRLNRWSMPSMIWSFVGVTNSPRSS